MNNGKSRSRPGFTLIELMTVIAIIVLLIGILIPALSSARIQAKKSSTAGLINAVERGCEMFQGDFAQYPQSRGYNPFEPQGDNILLMGAQWLGLQLVGPDMRGIVDWRDLRNDSDNDQDIDQDDWLDWYSLDPTREYTRMGPYASVEGSAVQSLVTYANVKSDITDWPDELEAGTPDSWNNGRIPFFIDAFSNPVLYYRANPKVNAPFTTGTPGDMIVGRYDQADNAYFTGSSGAQGRYPSDDTPGWDLSGAGYVGDYAHDLGDFGYTEDQLEFPEPKTFAAFLCDGNIFDNTQNADGEGRLWPYKPDSYLLISAGEDGVYGTMDDIANFKAGN